MGWQNARSIRSTIHCWKANEVRVIKPGPTLDYSKINPKPDYGKIEREAHTIDYSDPKNVQVKKPWSGAAARRDQARARIAERQNQNALEAIESKRASKKKLGV